MLTHQKTLPVWTPRHWQAFCYICNLALSVSFTKNFSSLSMEVEGNEKRNKLLYKVLSWRG